MLASNDSFGSFKSEINDPTSDGLPAGSVDVAALAATAQATGSAGAEKPKPTATQQTQQRKRTTTEPVIDRVAAALPPKRRGLFGRPLNQPRAKAPRATRQAQAAPRKRGLFKRLRGRNTQTARAWGLGPAR
jgi:hypothetical protein